MKISRKINEFQAWKYIHLQLVSLLQYLWLTSLFSFLQLLWLGIVADIFHKNSFFWKNIWKVCIEKYFQWKDFHLVAFLLERFRCYWDKTRLSTQLLITDSKGQALFLPVVFWNFSSASIIWSYKRSTPFASIAMPQYFPVNQCIWTSVFFPWRGPMAGSSISQFKDGSAPVHDSTKIEKFPRNFLQFSGTFSTGYNFIFPKKFGYELFCKGSKDRQIARAAGVKPPQIIPLINPPPLLGE